jgi:hypothetical protein
MENEAAQDDGWVVLSLRAKTSSREQESKFDLVGLCGRLSYVRLMGSHVRRVGQVLPLQGVYRFESL